MYKYLVVLPDIHFYDSTISTLKGLQETYDKLISTVNNIVDTYRKMGQVYLITLGDVYHRDFKFARNSIKFSNFFQSLNERGVKVYSVIGNHELSAKNSPFWLLAKTSSKNIEEDFPLIDNRSFGEIQVEENLLIDNVNILFNHYVRDGYGLYAESLKPEHRLIIMSHSPLEKVERADYIFSGHIHTDIRISKNNYKLGSLTPTSVSDFDYTRRFIPVVRISGSDIECEILDYEFPKWEEIVDITKATESREKYQEKVREYQLIKANIDIGDPIENIRAQIRNHKQISEVFEKYINDPSGTLTEKRRKEKGNFF